MRHPLSTAAGGLPPADARSASTSLIERAVARAKEGDMSAIDFLYVRFADDVRCYVQSIIRDSHAAQDITQNVFAKLITAIQKYEPREAPFAGWLLGVARNVALDHIRARRAAPREPDAAPVTAQASRPTG